MEGQWPSALLCWALPLRRACMLIRQWPHGGTTGWLQAECLPSGVSVQLGQSYRIIFNYLTVFCHCMQAP